jgi:group II intron reverse transcriptase/maturase
MQNADALLTIYRKRGNQGLPLERVYRQLFNREHYLRAYAKLYRNAGALTEGSTTETVDGMSLAKIDRIIEALRYERYQWTPARRVYIPKASGKRRPLGMPSWSDKLLQEVIRTLLEAYYEPQFSDHSHGFRPNRGCHTALTTIQQTWKGTKWFIEGDITQYFDTIDHTKLLTILRQKIHDERFLRLIAGLLKAGYLEQWHYHPTLSGTPQGGVLSPLLSNIYLDHLDQYITHTLIPAHTRGKLRRTNPAYAHLSTTIRRERKARNWITVKELTRRRRTLSSRDPNDPGYRRLRYIRYADDFLLGYVGTQQEAEDIKRHLTEWLNATLALTLSEEKTLITHARSQPARFLGYDVVSQHEDAHITKGRRSLNERIGLRVPTDVVRKKIARYTKDNKPRHRPTLMEESDYAITTTYQQEYRGIVQYYLLAHNVYSLNQFHYVMKRSLLQTLAAKHKANTISVLKKYRTTTTTADGKRLSCLEVRVAREGKTDLIARFGGLSLTRTPQAILDDNPVTKRQTSTELIQRLTAEECELCGSHEKIQVHHIRKLANLTRKWGKEPPGWVRRMAEMRRKTLVVCHACHVNIHAGRPTRTRQTKV